MPQNLGQPTLFGILHTRQSILSFHIILLFKSHFKEKESQIQRGKFPSYGHPVVRRWSQFKRSLASKPKHLPLNISRKHYIRHREAHFYILHAVLSLTLNPTYLSIPHPAQLGFYSIRSSEELKELQIYLKSQANLKINQEYLFCSKQMPSLMCLNGPLKPNMATVSEAWG